MKYKYDKENLLLTLKNLERFVDNNWDKRQDKKAIDDLLSGIEEVLDRVQSDYDDCFGTEGYEFNIMTKVD
jgi:hypothetical protein